jgi:pimeloyl-ACP methyl ester carboxylesterase
MRFEEKPITINGLKTVYIEAGKGDTLIFVPGWGATGNTYNEVLKRLAENYHVYSLDLPGFGKAQTPDHIWSLAEYGEFVATFIHELNLKDITLAGHSVGGAMAIYTNTKSQTVNRLILIDPYGLPLGHSRFSLITRYINEFFTEARETKQMKFFIRTTTNFTSILGNITYTLPYSLKVFTKQLNYDKSLFQKISLPVLILWGKDDKIFGKTYAKELNNLLPNAEIHEVIGTHNWILFRPQQLLTYL